MRTCAPCASLGPLTREEDIRSLELEPPSEGRESNQGPLQDQQVFLTAETSPEPGGGVGNINAVLFLCHYIP